MLDAIELNAVSWEPLDDAATDTCSNRASFGDAGAFVALARNCVGYAARGERPVSEALLLAEVFARMAVERDGSAHLTLLAGVLMWRHNLLGTPSEPDQMAPLVEAMLLLDQATEAGDQLAAQSLRKYADVVSSFILAGNLLPPSDETAGGGGTSGDDGLTDAEREAAAGLDDGQPVADAPTSPPVADKPAEG